ncbi:uncharacterized protein FPRO_08986 [Fusarium proliferatum ET1]|uniref:Uncharacterized protein n=2 Tax=Gibberella intermedia TaxID=948311 RepID=A0A1L7W9L1_FUSPR|nr:uncharacterized protein FPRO_08986 [Fusarium proliferatum ET1]RBA17663.1 hypothetical protein FPRO05_11378 [Fusarium proliferatum]CZR49274.1 uncharacterized protein FPRO_08986 [Fusarium proliferatum ET1]
MNEEDFVCLYPGSMPVVPIVAGGELWHPRLCSWGIPPTSDIPPQAEYEELHANSPEDERNPVIKAEPSSPDTLAAPESPRSPCLYDIPPFRRSQSPSPVNSVKACVDIPENEATVAVKPEPSSPETVQDVVGVPRSPRSPLLYDILRFYAAPDLSPPQPSPEDMERPIPSRAPSPRTSPQRNTLGGRINGRGIRRNLQFFINRGNQRRAIGHAQMLRRRRMQEEQFGIRQYRRHVDELQRQHEQRLRDGENAPCNSIPVSRGRRFHGAPRFVERFSVRDEEESGCMSPYDLY